MTSSDTPLPTAQEPGIVTSKPPIPQGDIGIVYQDEDLLVADKPAGLLTVPGRGIDKQDCLINRLLVKFPNARIVHRLDQATSGLVIIPLSYESQRHIAKQFEQRSTDKEYIAVVDGLVEDDEGEITLPLICDWPNRPKQMVDHENGKQAHTCYRVLARDPDKQCSRLLLKPITGRSHQLRVHTLALGHPILGDSLYAHPRALASSPRLLLHAQSIGFDHPRSNERLQLQLPANF